MNKFEELEEQFEELFDEVIKDCKITEESLKEYITMDNLKVLMQLSYHSGIENLAKKVRDGKLWER